MAGRQGTAGRGGPVKVDDAGPAFIVHNADHVRSVLAASERSGRAVTLVTPPRGAAYLGLPYLKDMIALAGADHPGVDFDTVLDAGDDAAIAHAALAIGWPVVVFQGTENVRTKLAEIAGHTGGKLIAAPPAAHDLQNVANPTETAEILLSGS